MNPLDFISDAFLGDGPIVFVAAVTALICVFAVYRSLLFHDPLGQRLSAIHARREALKAGLTAPRRRTRRDQSLGIMRRMVNALNLLRSREAKKAAARLAQAGWRSRDAVVIYFFFKMCLPFIFGATILFLLYVVRIIDTETNKPLLLAIGAVLLGTYGPDIYVTNATTKRRKEIQNAVPDALDLLVICAEAGQSLDGSLKRVAAELGHMAPALAEEIELTSVELGLLPDRRQALENLALRTGAQAIKAVVTTLAQTEKYGTPLAQSLRVLAAEYRTERLMRAEEKAARLPAILTVPMILFIMPPLFIVLLGPAIIRTLAVLGR
jgi:tight adherence protein C